VGQPVLAAILTLAIAIVLTTAVAVAASATEMLTRAMKLAVVGAAIMLAVVTVQRAAVRINFTGSVPIGIYALSPLPSDGVKRGMLVAACAPARAAALGLRRGYLEHGPCGDGTELLLKFVAAIAGDEVDITATGVTVNGCALPHSRPVSRDRIGRKLAAWRLRHRRLAKNQVWLYAADNRSWDSRYWGPASAVAIAAEAVPVVLQLVSGQSSRTWGVTTSSAEPSC
jgi:conjugative transfer signal peptidase TraF